MRETELSKRSIPLYTQIASSIRSQIDDGRFTVGDALPSIQALSVNFGVAPETIRQALVLLEREGLVKRKQGRGTLVEAQPRDLRWLALPTDWNSLVRFVDRLEVRRLLIETSERSPEIGKGEGVVLPAYKFLKRVHSRGGEPFCVLSAYLSAEIYLSNPEAFREQVIVPALARMEGVDIGKVRQTLRFDMADMDVAKLLDVPIASPVVWARRTICDRAGNVIYMAETAYRGDVVSLEMDLSPPEGDRLLPTAMKGTEE